MTVYDPPWRGAPPSMVITELPAPRTLAPRVSRKFCRSTISGSRAALVMVVVPLAHTAASMAFSVAPTLGRESTISAPWRAPWQSIPPGSSVMVPPRARMAARWRSMGRGPSSQPPGAHRLARPIRPSTAPRKITEERISRMSRSGTSHRVGAEASTMTAVPSRRAEQPRWRRMAREASTSDRSGQLWMTHSPGASRAAARMGSTLFLAPWTATEPLRGKPPSTRYVLICLPPHLGFGTPSYAEEGIGVHFPCFLPSRPESTP